MSSSLVIELRKFYMELVLSGFTEEQAFELTKMRVPEMEELRLTVNPSFSHGSLSGGYAGAWQHAAPNSTAREVGHDPK